ncbi:hypothetical protein C8R47DRAFT_1171260 [Mycena vitilis]|nr:hypothetical protein C8R47DRAFT_1171260 [Mycena vitilis]
MCHPQLQPLKSGGPINSKFAMRAVPSSMPNRRLSPGPDRIQLRRPPASWFESCREVEGRVRSDSANGSLQPTFSPHTRPGPSSAPRNAFQPHSHTPIVVHSAPLNTLRARPKLTKAGCARPSSSLIFDALVRGHLRVETRRCECGCITHRARPIVADPRRTSALDVPVHRRRSGERERARDSSTTRARARAPVAT